MRPIGRKSALLALVVTIIRGGNQVALKFALTAFAPFWTAFGRMAIGAAAVGCWSGLRGIQLRTRPGEKRALASLGLLFVAQIGLMHYGADFTSPAYATVLMNSNPVFANFFAHFVVPGDRLSKRRLLGLAIAFAGVCVVFPRASRDPLGLGSAVGQPLVAAIECPRGRANDLHATRGSANRTRKDRLLANDFFAAVVPCRRIMGRVVPRARQWTGKSSRRFSTKASSWADWGLRSGPTCCGTTPRGR